MTVENGLGTDLKSLGTLTPVTGDTLLANNEAEIDVNGTFEMSLSMTMLISN